MDPQLELEEERLDMPTAANSKETEVGLELVNTIDLSMVKMKLMDKDEGVGWDEEFAAFAEIRYRRYLCLQILYPKQSIVPTKDIDTFWHQHILDTRAYAKDCQKLFGQFLHHYPYFGMRDEQDAQDLLDSFEESKILYLKHFNEQLSTSYSSADSSTCHKGTSTCHKCADNPSGCKDTISCTRCH